MNKKEYDQKYKKERTKRIVLELNKNTDADIIEHLDNLEEPKQTYIKKLIRKAKGE